MHTVIPAQLRWACRRGMLELDVLLGNFLEEAFLNISSEYQKKFINLLDHNDQDLYMWLTAKTVPDDQEVSSIVERIRNHAQSRHRA